MSLLEKLKLSKNLEKLIKSDFDDVYTNFSKQVSNRSTFFKFEQIDFLYSSKEELIGYVKKDNFKVRLKNRSSILKINGFPTIANGTLKKQGNETLIVCKVSPMSFSAKIYYPFLILFLTLISLNLLSSDVTNQEKLIGLALISFFTILGLIVPFYIMRKDVAKLYEYIDTKITKE